MDAAFSRPLAQRIEIIARWIEECSNKELENLLPALVDNIFGETNKVGWGLRTIQYQTFPVEYDMLYKFLHPEGPVFCLCYRLLSDTYLKYEFPLTNLPTSLKKALEEGLASPFYSDKLHYDQKTRQPLVLILNALEYYMFHFVFHLVNPWLEINCQESNMNLQGVTLYLRLAEQYMLTFLPLDGSVVLPKITHYMAQSPNRSLPIYSPNKPIRTPTILRPDVLLKHNSNVHNSTQTAPHLEIWRSQLLVQLCLDFLFCVPKPDDNKWCNRSTSPLGWPSSSTTSQLPSTNTNMSSLWSQPVYVWPREGSTPTGEHLRVARVFIKHLHYFANSRVENSSSMNELKRIIIPTSQNKIYKYIKYTMDHWPLDASFKLILETWLSFIQPWRYTDFNKNSMNLSEKEEKIDRWLQFIAENLLAYTGIFQNLILRFSRLDLSTPRNALILFRVTKVFSKPNLNILVKQIESSLVECGGKSGFHKWGSVVRTQLIELEGVRFQYVPLFCDDVIANVLTFMEYIQQAMKTAKDELEVKIDPNRTYASIINEWLFSKQMDNEYTLEERKKVPAYLETSFCHLSEIFNLDEAQLKQCLEARMTNTNVSTQSHSKHSPMEMRKHVWDMQYQGDPDLKPIQSFEVKVLVRLLYYIASWINLAYGREIFDLYTQNSLSGRIARQLLCGPTRIFYFDKRIPGHCPRKSYTLPPRLSLRCWANTRLLGLILITFLLVKFIFKISIFLSWLTIFLLWVLYLLLNALIGRSSAVPNLNDIDDISMFNAYL